MISLRKNVASLAVSYDAHVWRLPRAGRDFSEACRTPDVALINKVKIVHVF